MNRSSPTLIVLLSLAAAPAPALGGPAAVEPREPLDGAALAPDQTVYVTASGAGGARIERVELWAGDLLLGRVEKAPFSFRLDPGSLPPGRHLLTARAVDEGGEEGEYSVTVDHLLAAR